MKLLQITDLHIGTEHENTNDVDVRQNFLDILQEVQLIQPDHIILSGDLCYQDGVLETYQWVKTQMDTLAIPYSVIAGNHDDSTMLANAFGLQSKLIGPELFYSLRLGEQPVLFLDSGKGYLSENQYSWLRDQLLKINGELVIFMHHPPALAGVPFMDKQHALQDIEQVQEILFEHLDNITIYCGHYHIEKTLRVNNLLIHITPSCYFQLNQRTEDFKIDHHRIAYREIDLFSNHITSTVHYLKGNVLVTSS